MRPKQELLVSALAAGAWPRSLPVHPPVLANAGCGFLYVWLAGSAPGQLPASPTPEDIPLCMSSQSVPGKLVCWGDPEDMEPSQRLCLC